MAAAAVAMQSATQGPSLGPLRPPSGSPSEPVLEHAQQGSAPPVPQHVTHISPQINSSHINTTQHAQQQQVMVPQNLPGQLQSDTQPSAAVQYQNAQYDNTQPNLQLVRQGSTQLVLAQQGPSGGPAGALADVQPRYALVSTSHLMQQQGLHGMYLTSADGSRRLVSTETPQLLSIDLPHMVPVAQQHLGGYPQTPQGGPLGVPEGPGDLFLGPELDFPEGIEILPSRLAEASEVVSKPQQGADSAAPQADEFATPTTQQMHDQEQYYPTASSHIHGPINPPFPQPIPFRTVRSANAHHQNAPIPYKTVPQVLLQPVNSNLVPPEPLGPHVGPSAGAPLGPIKRSTPQLALGVTGQQPVQFAGLSTHNNVFQNVAAPGPLAGPQGVPHTVPLQAPLGTVDNPLPSKLVARKGEPAPKLPPKQGTQKRAARGSGKPPQVPKADKTATANDRKRSRNDTASLPNTERAPSEAAAAGSQGPSGGPEEDEEEADMRDKRKAKKARSSQYRGVTKHRRSGRWEAHLWVKDVGKQVYLGGYDTEEHAAEAYDVAALKVKGRRVKTNFDLSRYTELLNCMDSISLDELVMAVRRQSQGFSRGSSAFRGVTKHPSGRWEARIGVPGQRHVYLGLYINEEDAAQAYDRAIVRLRGPQAATNYSLADYNTQMAEHINMAQRVQVSGAMDIMSCLGDDFERWIKLGTDGAAAMAAPGRAPSTEPHAGSASAAEEEQIAADMQHEDAEDVQEGPVFAEEGAQGPSRSPPRYATRGTAKTRANRAGQGQDEACLLPMRPDMMMRDDSHDLVLLPHPNMAAPDSLMTQGVGFDTQSAEGVQHAQYGMSQGGPLGPAELPQGPALLEGAAKALAQFGKEQVSKKDG